MFQFTPEVVVESYVETSYTFTYGFNKYKQEKVLPLQSRIQKVLLPAIEVCENCVELWWPRGYGKQALYQAYVSLPSGYDYVYCITLWSLF